MSAPGHTALIATLIAPMLCGAAGTAWAAQRNPTIYVLQDAGKIEIE